MPAISFNMINHFRYIKEAITKHDLQARVDFEECTLTITNDKTEFTFFPTFQNKDGLYSQELSEQAVTFMGWRPYTSRAWEAATNKLTFKKLLKKNDIKTPDFYIKSEKSITDVIIKRSVSSFGEGMKGPIKSSLQHDLNKRNGEFFEQYIDGEIFKIWFLNNKPEAAETLPHLSVNGDGHSTIDELITAHATAKNRKINTSYFEEFLLYQDLSLTSVLAKNKKCSIDYRYKSILQTSHQTKDIKISENPRLKFNNELKKIGDMVKKESPKEIQNNFVYAIDAMMDKDRQLWILELNTNPHIHPYLYGPMIANITKTIIPSTNN